MTGLERVSREANTWRTGSSAPPGASRICQKGLNQKVVTLFSRKRRPPRTAGSSTQPAVWHFDETAPIQTTLSSGISDTDTSLTVESLGSFLEGDFALLGSEIVKVVSIAGNTADIVRGQKESTATAHDSGARLIRLDKRIFHLQRPEELLRHTGIRRVLGARAVPLHGCVRGGTVRHQSPWQFADGGVKRDVREKLLEAVRRREIDVVLVWRLDS